ncbi:MAG: hypothetical protein HY060_20835, partial [Proteobacteria bacterium]|nr:hypothetical protein [Pseudomonadota bacterium]
MRLAPRLALALLLVLPAGCERADAPRTAACQRIIPALEDATPVGPIESRRTEDTVSLVYRIAGHAEPRSLVCRFGAGTELVGVASSATGALSPPRLAMLRIWLGLADDPAALAPAPAVNAAPPLDPLGYLLQQLANGLALGAI